MCCLRFSQWFVWGFVQLDAAFSCSLGQFNRPSDAKYDLTMSSIYVDCCSLRCFYPLPSVLSFPFYVSRTQMEVARWCLGLQNLAKSFLPNVGEWKYDMIWYLTLCQIFHQVVFGNKFNHFRDFETAKKPKYILWIKFHYEFSSQKSVATFGWNVRKMLLYFSWTVITTVFI